MARYYSRRSDDPAEREVFEAISRAEKELERALERVRRVSSDDRDAVREEVRRRRPVADAIERSLGSLRGVKAFRAKPEPPPPPREPRPRAGDPERGSE